MTFSALETSRTKGRPVNLFYIRYGSVPSAFFAYTDAEKEIAHGGVVYRPVPINRGKIAITGTMDKTALEIRCAETLDISEQFRVYPPSQVVNVIVRQGHYGDTDYIVAWTGRVLSTKRTDSNELVMTCEPLATTMKRIGLRRHYQYSCPHVLYGEHCKASKLAATTSTTVSSLSGTVIVLPSLWVPTSMAAKYVGGMVEWTNTTGDKETRTILQVAGDFRSLTVSGFLRGLEAGDPIDVILGCNRQLVMHESGTGLDPSTDCHFLHGNMNNFGGCAFIPTKNPVGRLNQFY